MMAANSMVGRGKTLSVGAIVDMDKQLSSVLLKQIESGYSLPSLSPVAMQLVEMALHESASAQRLTTLIEKDPSLAVRVLKLANSAFFRTLHPTTSLKQAVVKVGLQRLRIMALSLSLRDAFPMGKIGALDYGQFWRLTLYRALIAKGLASYTKGCSPEEAFVAGLIMEVGLLILFDLRIRQDTDAPPIKLEPLEELLMWERDSYGVDHRQVGEAALKCWRFPESVVQCQLLYGKAALSEDAPEIARVYELSREFSCLLSQESKGFDAFLDDGKRILGLPAYAVNDMLVAAFDEVQEIAESLSVEVNKERDLLEIMEKANRALSQISDKISEHQEITDKAPLPSFDSIEERQDIVEQTLQAVAHEIRNPLLAVGGFARKLVDSLDPGSEGGGYAKIILEEAARLEKALSQMGTEET
jgi:HD-like signal output (HDOD) protein